MVRTTARFVVEVSLALRLGKYELLSRIAKGGMAETFRARFEGAAGVVKQVAIKKVLPGLAEDEEFIASFISEAKLSAGLSHGNIAQVFEFGQVDGDYFLAMEWVDGRSLAQILKRLFELRIAFLPPSIACFLAIEVLKALHYAHTRVGEDGKPLGIVHRDVSPENILVGFEGQVKVVDFGIAMTALKGRKETEPGLVKGKFQYFSPEQANLQGVDGRSDLFSLGIVLYELLSGRAPFVGQMHVVIHLIQHAKFTPLREVNPLVPARLAEVVERAMTKDLGARFGSALEMQQALTSLLYREDPTFSSETVKDWMSSLFAGPAAVHAEEQLEEVKTASARAPEPSVPSLPVVVTQRVPQTPAKTLQRIAVVGVGAMVLLSGLTLLAIKTEPEPLPPPPSEKPRALTVRPPAMRPEPKPTLVPPVDVMVYPATVVLKGERHRIRFDGVPLPTVTFAAGAKPQLAERDASDQDSPLFARSNDGAVHLVLQKPTALPNATSAVLFDMRPFEAGPRGIERKIDVGAPATRLTFADSAVAIDARAATWMTVESVPPNEKVKLTLRALQPEAWAGRPRPASVLVVWKRAFGRLLPPPGGDWPDTLDRAVLTTERPLVLEGATAVAFVLADGLVGEKESMLVEVFGTGEPASKPDPAALARAAKQHLEKTPTEKEKPTTTSRRRPIPKTIDLNAPTSDVFFDEGLTAFQEGRLPAAKAKLEKCVSMAPKDFECHKLLGAIHDRLGDGKRAVRSYREFLRLAPAGDPDIPKVEQLLQLHGAKP